MDPEGGKGSYRPPLANKKKPKTDFYEHLKSTWTKLTQWNWLVSIVCSKERLDNFEADPGEDKFHPKIFPHIFGIKILDLKLFCLEKFTTLHQLTKFNSSNMILSWALVSTPPPPTYRWQLTSSSLEEQLNISNYYPFCFWRCERFQDKCIKLLIFFSWGWLASTC